jgi:hypothetical protein
MPDAPVIVGYTGPRKGMHRAQSRVLPCVLHALARKIVAHHGDCVGGDAEFHDMIRAEFELSRVVIHPPEYEGLRAFKEADEYRQPAPFGDRDRRMVEEVEVLVATPGGFEERRRGSGTWLTIRHAKRVRRPLVVVWPDGRAEPFFMPWLGLPQNIWETQKGVALRPSATVFMSGGQAARGMLSNSGRAAGI